MKRLRLASANKLPLPSEQASQAAFFAWWGMYARTKGIPELLCFAVPNGAMLGGGPKLRAIQMGRLKAAGLRPGVADVMLLIPSGGFHGLVLEFKRAPNKPTPDQVAFLAEVRLRSYNALVVYSTDEAIHIVKAYLAAGTVRPEDSATV